MSSGAPFSLLEIIQAYPLLHKGLGHLAAPYLPLLLATHYKLPYQNYLLTIISVLTENTLLKTAYHFLLLLVGFDTLTYRKDYDRSPILVGHQESFVAPLSGSEVPLVRKNLYSVLKFTVTCYCGKLSSKGLVRGIFTPTGRANSFFSTYSTY